MKKVLTLLLCLFFVLPAVSFAQNPEARIGVIMIDDGSLLSDNEISATIEKKMAEIVGDGKYEYVPFTELETEFNAFLSRNNIQNNNQLTDDVLVKFAQEQNLNYLCFLNFNLEELQYDRVFFKSAYRAMLGVDVKYYNVSSEELLYANHLFADGSDKNESSACRKSAAKLMRRVAWQFSPDNF
ncbi:MAG: hypothetical protein ACRC8T_07190 [Acidaminococcaceae bacterium]